MQKKIQHTIHIATIAEGVQGAERGRKVAGSGDRFAPCIVLIFYNKCTICVNDADDVALEVVNIAVHFAVVFYKRGSRLIIIEKMQMIIAFISIYFYSSLGQKSRVYSSFL